MSMGRIPTWFLARIGRERVWWWKNPGALRSAVSWKTGGGGGGGGGAGGGGGVDKIKTGGAHSDHGSDMEDFIGEPESCNWFTE